MRVIHLNASESHGDLPYAAALRALSAKRLTQPPVALWRYVPDKKRPERVGRVSRVTVDGHERNTVVTE